MVADHSMASIPAGVTDSRDSCDFAAFAGVETPAYLLDPGVVVDACAALRSALGTALVVSLKANANPDLFVRAAHAFGDGVEVASLGELNVVVGRLDRPKYVNSPAADDRLILACSASRGILVVDSLDQAQRTVALKPRLRNPLPILLRLNAGALLGDAVPPGRRDHFGMTLDDAAAAGALLAGAGFEVRGVHLFAGSNGFAQLHMAVAAAMPVAIARIEDAIAAPLTFVNLGGGFGEDWQDEAIDFAAYRRAIAPLGAGRVLAHEAGRAIFAHSGTFATRVVATKTLGGATIAVCDGGFAHAFRLAQTEAFVRRRQVPRVLRTTGSDAATTRVVFVGNTCSPADVIGEGDMAPPVPGDIVVFDRCGAYASYSPTAFLNLKPAQRYVVS